MKSIAAAVSLLIASAIHPSTFVECFQFQLRPSSTTLRVGANNSHGRSMTINTIAFPRPVYFTKLYSENPKGNSDEEILDADEKIISVGGESYEGSVDWDAEWKKVVENRDQPSQRPGNYKSPVEISVIKATNKVAKNVFDASKDMKANMPSVPSIRSLQGDWRFWIGMLLIVSFGLSILSVSSSTTSANESFYI